MALGWIWGGVREQEEGCGSDGGGDGLFPVQEVVSDHIRENEGRFCERTDIYGLRIRGRRRRYVFGSCETRGGFQVLGVCHFRCILCLC